MQQGVSGKAAAPDSQRAIATKHTYFNAVRSNRRVVEGKGPTAVHESFECPAYVIGATIKIDRRAGRKVAAIDLKGRIGGDCSGA